MAPHVTPAPNRHSHDTWPNGEPTSVRNSIKTYHFIITASSPDGMTATFSGLYDVVRDQSRASVYADLYQMCRERISNRINIMFFSLEPDELSV